MPKTTTGLAYKLRDAKTASPCIVCKFLAGEPCLEILLRVTHPDWPGLYSFPVCSLICVLSWTELLSRAASGDSAAMAVAIKFMRAHDGK